MSLREAKEALLSLTTADISKVCSTVVSCSACFLDHPESEDAFYSAVAALTAHLLSKRGCDVYIDARKVLLKFAVSRLTGNSASCLSPFQLLILVGCLFQKQDVDFDEFSCLTSLQELLQSSQPPDEPTGQETSQVDEKKDEEENAKEDTSSHTETQKKTREDFGDLLSQLTASSTPEVPSAMTLPVVDHRTQQNQDSSDWKSQLIIELKEGEGFTAIITAVMKLTGVRELVQLQSDEMPKTLSQDLGESVDNFMSKLNLLSGMFTLIPSLVKQGTDLLDEQLQWLSQLGVTSYQALYVAALEQDTETEAETDCDEEDNMSQLTAMKTTECCLHMTSSIISMLPSGIAHNVQLIGVVVTMAGFDLVKKQGPANGKVNMYKIDNCVAVAAPSFLSNLSTLLSEFTDDVQPSQPAAENVTLTDILDCENASHRLSILLSHCGNSVWLTLNEMATSAIDCAIELSKGEKKPSESFETPLSEAEAKPPMTGPPPLPLKVSRPASSMLRILAKMTAMDEEALDDDFPAIRELFDVPPQLSSDDGDSSIPTPPPLPPKPQRSLITPLEERQQLHHEPKVFVGLALKALSLMEKQVIQSSNEAILSAVSLFMTEDAFLSEIARLLKLLDTDTELYKSVPQCQDLSDTLGSLVNLLLAKSKISRDTQLKLLGLLGIDLSEESQQLWPLCVRPRALGVLAHILVTAQDEQDKESLGSPSAHSLCERAWQRFIVSLTHRITNHLDIDEDLNVEHIQVLQLVYEHFGSDQMKIFQSCLCPSLLEVAQHSSNVSDVPLLASRLLLIFYYMLHTVAGVKTDQFVRTYSLVSLNVFRRGGPSGLMPNLTDVIISSDAVICHPFFGNMDNQYQTVKSDRKKKEANCSVVPKEVAPLFYGLIATDFIERLDSKIVSVLSSLTSGGYSEMYRCLANLISLGCCCSTSLDETCAGLRAGASTTYSFIICWQLILALPPSLEFLDLQQTMLSAKLQAPSDWCQYLVCRCITHFLCAEEWRKDDVVKCMVDSGVAESESSAIEHLQKVIELGEDNFWHLDVMQHCLNELFTTLLGISDCYVMPSPLLLSCFDATISGFHLTLDNIYFTKPEGEQLDKTAKAADKALPVVLRALSLMAQLSRCYVVGKSQLPGVSLSIAGSRNSSKCSSELASVVLTVSRVKQNHVPKQPSDCSLSTKLPGSVEQAITEWEDTAWAQFPSVSEQLISDKRSSKTASKHFESVACAHYGILTENPNSYHARAIKHLMLDLVKLADDLYRWHGKDSEDELKELVLDTLTPLTTETTTGFLYKKFSDLLESVAGSLPSEAFTKRQQTHVLTCCHDLLMNYRAVASEYVNDVLSDCIVFLQTLMEKPQSRETLLEFYSKEGDLIAILLTPTEPSLPCKYGAEVLRLFNKIISLYEKSPKDTVLRDLALKLNKLELVQQETLETWLKQLIVAKDDDVGAVQPSQSALNTFVHSLVKGNSLLTEASCLKLLHGLLPLGSLLLESHGGSGFSDYLSTCKHLAGFSAGQGHVDLFQAATEWLKLMKSHVVDAEELDKSSTTVVSTCSLLSYIADVMSALKTLTGSSAVGVTDNSDVELSVQEIDSDRDEVDDDDEASTGEESDGEDALCNQLCTFTITQKEFMNQHWYHCHTCLMVDGVGVCTICAKVCHKDHDLSYAKCGAFFCDCGAKEDGSCKALVKRVPGVEEQASSKQPDAFKSHDKSDAGKGLSLKGKERKRRAGSPRLKMVKKRPRDDADANKPSAETVQLATKIKAFHNSIQDIARACGVPDLALQFVQSLIPHVLEASEKHQAESGIAYGLKMMTKLHTEDKEVETVDTLTTGTLSSQEGAFENVKLSLNGEQGQLAKKLIGSNVLTRVGMCALGVPGGKKHFLMVCHDKGKITVLQLSSLLKQAESSKKKLTLARLSSSSIPFTILTAAANMCNEDCVAVCGLKECQVLTFSSSGAVSDHLVLHPSLEGSGAILKPLWIPGSQTELAIITTDFIKIYDLSVDAISPCFYFLLPSGKIRDATFACSEQSRVLIVMSSKGQLYIQPMDQSTSADHGPFYLTLPLNVEHSSLKESEGQIAGGGISVHYSHPLQLLFFSYSQGQSFAASMADGQTAIQKLFPLIYKSGGIKNQSGLCQWSDVVNHPGLLVCMTQPAGTPVMLMVKPDRILIQEFKNIPSKSKAQGIISVHHGSGDQQTSQHTTTIVLCEDGSLRIYLASNEKTKFWLSPVFQPTSQLSVVHGTAHKKSVRSTCRSGQVKLPVDFFETLQSQSEIEFGGKDILHVYNNQQVKLRLNTTGMYIASSKQGGFEIKVNNPVATTVMVGVRIQVGCQSIERAPSYLELFGRQIPVSLTRNRWYDVAFTREEALSADKKFTVKFGASGDPSGITMVDSIKVFVKTKEAFGWPDEPQEDLIGGFPALATSTVETPNVSGEITLKMPTTNTDQIVASCLQTLDGSITQEWKENVQFREACLSVATQLLMAHTPSVVLTQTKALLATLHPTKQAYYVHKDEAQLSQVVQLLDSASAQAEPMDVDSFRNLLGAARSVGVVRPTNFSSFIANHPVEPKQTDQTEDASGDNETKDQAEETPELRVQAFISKLMDCFWKLYGTRCTNPTVSAVCSGGLVHIEATVTALVEIIHSFLLAEASPASLAADCYAELLLCQDPAVSFACRQAIEYMLRPRRKRKHVATVAAVAVAPEPNVDRTSKQTETPGKEPAVDEEEEEERKERRRHDQEAAAALRQLASGRMPPSGRPRMPLPPSMAAMMDEYMAAGHPPPPEALEMMMGPYGAMAGRGPRQGGPRSAMLDHMLHMAGMVDDDAMMELAIQLSLQEQESGGSEASSQVPQQIQAGGQREAREHQQLVAEESSESAHRDKERQPQAQPREWQSTSPEYVVPGEEDSLSQSTLSGDEAHEAEVATQQDVNGVIEAVEDVLQEHSDSFPREVLEVAEPHVDDILHQAEELYDDLAHHMEVLDMGLEEGLVIAHPHPLLDVEDQQELPDQQIHVEEQQFQQPQVTQELKEDSSLPSEEATLGDQDFTFEVDDELVSINSHLHQLRLSLLKLLLKHLPQLRKKGGVQSIPFLQVLLFLSSHLGNGEDDKAALDQLLESLVTDLDFETGSVDSVAERNNSQKEVQILILRFCSILMSKTKPSESSCDVSLATCQALVHSGAVEYCLKALTRLLDYWKEHKGSEEQLVGTVSVPGALLKRHPMFPIPDMSPFFMRQYVRSHMKDIFGSYPQLLTELLLRIPYQIKKVSCSSAVPSVEFGKAWKRCLAEFMLFQQSTPVKKQVRKLLLFLCKSKEKYRQLRDLHALAFHLQFIRDVCARGGFEAVNASFVPLSLPYDTLLTLMERVKACNDIAVVRTTNWQRFCCQEPGTLLYLLQISLQLPEGIVQQLLQLMACALCGGPTLPPSKSQARKEKGQAVQTSTTQTQQNTMSETQVQMCEKLVGQLMGDVSDCLLTTFVRAFMLESNSSNIRWQSHALLITLHKHSQLKQQHHLAELVWALWPQLPLYGRKATQFVDLLGHFITKSPSPVADAKSYSSRATELLKSQNKLLHSHPNSHVYGSLQALVEFDGYYLESDPCLVCNNPEVPYANTKLSSLKVDTRYTTTSQLVKLSGSCGMSKFLIRISDVRRAKMVRTINLYYTNRTVQSVIELKNKRSLWKHAKRCHLTPGQTEVKIDFPLPIVACNIIVEFSDFYDNFQATSETLQCPRCSAQVNANPGICGNCGENVFQCHKCRSINYDEKDPFLCISCGYCKYARFDFSLVCKPCCAVDPIETDEDRKKANSTINTLLDRADRVYKQLLAHRQPLDLLLAEVGDQGELETRDEAEASSLGGTNRSGVNKMIQALAQRYCGDCKSSFEELSKIMQKVLACRKEIVEFDRQQLEKAYTQQSSRSSTPASTPTTPQADHFSTLAPFPLGPPHVSQRKLAAGAIAKPDCYGCMTAATEHCVALLRALAAQPETRKMLIDQGLIQELVSSNLRRGSLAMRREVRALICLLTRDNVISTRRLNRILLRHMKAAIDQHQSNPSLISSIQHEMHLLMATIDIQDSCWEDRLRCILKLFLYSNQANSAVVMEHITLPCLKVLLHVMKLPAKIAEQLKEKGLPQARELGSQLNVAAERWLVGDPKHSFQAWKRSLSKAKDEARELYLREKYGRRWLAAVKKRSVARSQLSTKAWLLRVLFTPSSKTARQVACSMVEALCEDDTRCHQILDLLSSCLGDLGKAGQNAAEFLQLYQKLSGPKRWKTYLAIKGLLPKLGVLITQEIKHLTELEQTTLSSDLSQGYALKMLTELLASFIEHDQIRQRYKGKLVATILDGYLALKRLVIQRTKLVDDTQELLLELLENMTSGTEEETEAFMTICIQTLSKCPVGDVLTPTFIAERLCSIISPEDNEAADFYVILDKDPAQEEFLQGRMQGNPYSCKEPSLGPLMRDIKNKICTDCELIALLDDDTGMELLVKNKIISLDLPVKEVYKKVWCRDPGDADKPMRVLYRMRGLLGEATEDMIQSLESADGEKDDEDVYHLSSVLSQCSGLEAVLERFSQVQSLIHGKQMVNALLKLLAYCVKVKANRRHLAQPQLNALNIMLSTLNQALRLERDHNDGSGAAMAEQVLLIIEAILLEASAVATAEGTVEEISTLSEDQSHLTMLLDFMDSPHVRSDASVLQAMMRLIPFLTYGDENRMQMLLDHFSPHLDFDRFDKEQGTDNKLFLDCFCNIASGIVSNAQGAQLKDLICENGIVDLAIQYVDSHLPEKPTIGVKPADDEAFKEFLARPSLPYILRMLTGLCGQHDRTQLAVGDSLIGAIHRLEQVSTEGSVGSLAENLMDALKGNPVVEKKVDEVRQQTKAEKKRLAMAMREKQLGALGMAMDEQGRVVATRQVEEEMTQLVEETGLRCCICLEGYKNQPKKALGMYTFTRRIVLDEFENKQRKTHGYTTVTHFNVVHYDCHYDAIKHSRSRDEWESASLYNGNTKCNGLLPVWGPDVSESVFAGNLARYNTNISECTGLHDTGYVFAIHDLRLLLTRFATEKSFSAETGGGGRDSNMKFIPYIISLALYIINTTRAAANLERLLTSFLETPRDRWVPTSYELESPLYYTVVSLFVLKADDWKQQRLTFLKRLIVLAQSRQESPSPIDKLSTTDPLEYKTYKPHILLWALVDMIHLLLKSFDTAASSSSDLCSAWLDWLRHNDQTVLGACEKMLSSYQEELLPVESFQEFFDATDILSEVGNPDDFIQSALQTVTIQ